MLSFKTMVVGGLLILLIPGKALAEDTRASHEDIEEIVVVASKIGRPLHRVASQVTQLHRDELLYQQLQSLSEVARYQAALDAEFAGDRFGNNGIAIRSIGGNRVAMELDGVPQPQHFAVGDFANASRIFVDPATIERIEILRGPASALYGSDAIGGVVAVTSTDPVDLVGPGRSSYFGGGGSYRGMDKSRIGYLTLARAGGPHGLSFTGSRSTGREIDNDLPEEVRPDRVDYADTGAFAKWTYSPSGDFKLTTIADHRERTSTSDLRAILGYGRQYRRTVELYGNDRQDRQRLSVAGVHTSPGGFDLVSFQAYYQRSETRQQTSDYRATDSLVDRLITREFSFAQSQRGVEAKFRKDGETGRFEHILVGGIEWEHRRLTEARDGLDTNLTTGATSKILPPGERLPQRDLPVSRVEAIGVYLQDEINLDNWTVIPAFRWDRFALDASTDALLPDATRLGDLDVEQVSARLGVTYRISDRVTWFAHYAEGFRAPPPEDVNLYLDYKGFVSVRALPNPDLRPEKSHNYESGIRFDARNTSFDVSLYRSNYDNFIESRVPIGVDPNDGALLFQSRNIQNARIEGIEVELEQALRVLSPALDNVSLNLSFHTARGESRDTGLPINLVSPPKGVVGLDWQIDPALSLQLLATHYDKQARVDTSDRDFFVPEAAFVFDLAARWAPSRSIELYAGIYNLADEQYWRYGDVRAFTPGDPRIQSLARPGRYLALSIHLGRQH